MELYIIIWQEYGAEPDWLHVVAKNLTESKADKLVRAHLLKDWDNPSPSFEYFWYTQIKQAEGVGTKNTYSIEVKKK